MRAALSALVLAAVVTLSAQAPDRAEGLQGRWVVLGGEHDGKPMDGIKGGIIVIAGTTFEIRTASGNMLKGTLRLDASKQPAQMDLVHADGKVWEAIYEVTGDKARLNYVEAGGADRRPEDFTTSDKTEASIVLLGRETRQP